MARRKQLPMAEGGTVPVGADDDSIARDLDAAAAGDAIGGEDANGDPEFVASDDPESEGAEPGAPAQATLNLVPPDDDETDAGEGEGITATSDESTFPEERDRERSDKEKRQARLFELSKEFDALTTPDGHELGLRPDSRRTLIRGRLLEIKRDIGEAIREADKLGVPSESTLERIITAACRALALVERTEGQKTEGSDA